MGTSAPNCEGIMEASQNGLMRRRSGRFSTSTRRGVTLLLATVLTFTAACTGSGGNGGETGSWEKGEDPPKASVSIEAPAADATDVPATAVITFKAEQAVETAVEVTDAAGKAVAGTVDEAGSTWTPKKSLAYGTTYTATVTATGDDGKPATGTSTFTVMDEPANKVAVSSFLGDDQTVGVGMPLIVRFGREIPADYRDDVQQRMSVTAKPAQEGIWHWISGTEVHYRPKDFWKANSSVNYTIKGEGLPVGGDWYLRNDLSVDINIGRELIMTVENSNKRMTVTRDGQVVKTIPVSLGKAKTPSSTGTMIVMEKLRKTVFDTLEELGPEEGYRTKIDYAQRLTWGGEFIHAAPWSEGQQGRVNVSHGCVNVSMADGKWLFAQTMLGDPITVQGTERKLANGNGWTDWNMSWDEYVKGSALPYEPAG